MHLGEEIEQNRNPQALSLPFSSGGPPSRAPSHLSPAEPPFSWADYPLRPSRRVAQLAHPASQPARVAQLAPLAPVRPAARPAPMRPPGAARMGGYAPPPPPPCGAHSSAPPPKPPPSLSLLPPRTSLSPSRSSSPSSTRTLLGTPDPVPPSPPRGESLLPPLPRHPLFFPSSLATAPFGPARPP
jgi:hypothetical protein